MTTLAIALLVFTSLQEPAKTGLQLSDGADVLKLGDTPGSFKGEAVLSNGRITLAVPKGGHGAELRVGAATRAILRLSGVETLDHVAVLEYGKGSATLEVGGKGAKGAVLARLKVKKGDVTVEIQPGEGAEKLRVD